MSAKNDDVSKTAFLVNESRRRRTDVSQDRYAYLWVNEETKRMWEHFAKHVTPHDDLVISLRHSYFLACINEFLKSNQNAVFINLASGFTSYPFLLDETIESIEVDYAAVISRKKQMVQNWIQEGLLPKRKVQYHIVNLLNRIEREKVFSNIASTLAGRPSIVLMEGLTYFLNKESLDDLVAHVERIQTKDSLLAFDFWQPDFQTSTLYKKLLKYVSIEWGFEATNLLFLTDADVTKIKSYTLVASSDGPSEELKKLGSGHLSDIDNSMIEHYRILQKL